MLTESRLGPGFKLSKLIQSGVEHAARANAPPAITNTRYIILTIHSRDSQAARPRVKDTGAVTGVQHVANH